jgi:hypothetical protein
MIMLVGTFFIFLNGCGEVPISGTYQDSRIMRSLGDFAPGKRPKEKLQYTAFYFLQGMSREEAINFLSNDGFECVNFNCTKTVIYQELSRAGIRPPDTPLRQTRDSWSIYINSPNVLSVTDIVANYY